MVLQRTLTDKRNGKSIPVQHMKTCMEESEGTAPAIPNLDSR